jgi:hypothetical protein
LEEELGISMFLQLHPFEGFDFQKEAMDSAVHLIVSSSTAICKNMQSTHTGDKRCYKCEKSYTTSTPLIP